MTEIVDLGVTRDGDTVRVRVSGEIDLSNAAALESDILVAADRGSTLVVDLTDVRYIDSAGLALLDRLARARVAAGHDLRVVAPRDSIAGDVIALSGLDRVITVES